MKYREHEVSVAIDSRISLSATLCVPTEPSAIVLVAHASGSGRFNPHQRRIASVLQQSRMATLLLDLLTAEEEKRDRWTHQLRGDIPLLGGRLVLATIWLRRQPDIYDLPVGIFATGTAAAATITAAAHETDRIRAVVSAGGRIDRVPADELEGARAKTLIVIGGADVPVLAGTRRTLPRLRCPHEVEVIPGAADLMDQPGALEQTARAASEFFVDELEGERPTRPMQPAAGARQAFGRAPVPRPSALRRA